MNLSNREPNPSLGQYMRETMAAIMAERLVAAGLETCDQPRAIEFLIGQRHAPHVVDKCIDLAMKLAKSPADLNRALGHDEKTNA